MLVAAITGNYGMGKSSVTRLFKKYGAFTLDADEIVSELLTRKNNIKRIRDMFGTEAMNADGSLNKKAIADIVFKDDLARRKLEAFLHPLVVRQIKAAIRKMPNTCSIAIVEIPLLFESSLQKNFDITITVYTNQKTALARLRGKGISRKEGLARLHAQMDIRQKKHLSDLIIDNSGTEQELMVQVRKVLKSLMDKKGQ